VDDAADASEMSIIIRLRGPGAGRNPPADHRRTASDSGFTAVSPLALDENQGEDETGDDGVMDSVALTLRLCRVKALMIPAAATAGTGGARQYLEFHPSVF